MLSNKIAAQYVANGFPILLSSDEAKLHCQDQIIKWANHISADIWAYESVISVHGVMLAPGSGSPFLHLMLEDDHISVCFFDEIDDMLDCEKVQVGEACRGLFLFLTAYVMMNHECSTLNYILPTKTIFDNTKHKLVYN